MGFGVGVIGGSGYAGGELLRLLARHPSFDLALVQGNTSAGRPLGDVHPQLQSLAALQIRPIEPAELHGVDVVFLALPHGRSAAIARQLPADALVVDLGADHRLTDAAAWDTYYGGDHAGAWTYGLSELPGARTEIASSRRIANPGCYPTASVLALAPLAAAGIVDVSDVVVVAASGTSGAGRAANEHLIGSEVMGSASAYKVGGLHQHTPEMQQALSCVSESRVGISFTPVLAPMPRGILATVSCRLANDDRAAGAVLRDTMEKAYADEPFVHVLDEGKWPRTADVLASNSAHVQVAFDPATGRVTLVSAIDNLGKGAAGQAVQNANIALGLDEGAGLAVDGVAP
jgi:N-acetyl-gamma-glutamyl-phosphate reductase